jgi:hypothetical protein
VTDSQQTVCTPTTTPRLALATLVALLLGLPVGWLLAALSLLPFFLGLFFFTLFGLLLGAVLYRVARPVAPVSAAAAFGAGAVVVLAVWFLALLIEAHNLPSDARAFFIESHKTMTPESLARAKAELPDRARQFLRDRYPPGGFIGYVRWAGSSGELPLGKTNTGLPVLFRLRQGPRAWIVRVILSAFLLAFGVLSQVMGLTRDPNETPEIAHELSDPRE